MDRRRDSRGVLSDSRNHSDYSRRVHVHVRGTETEECVSRNWCGLTYVKEREQRNFPDTEDEP